MVTDYERELEALKADLARLNAAYAKASVTRRPRLAAKIEANQERARDVQAALRLNRDIRRHDQWEPIPGSYVRPQVRR